MLLDIVGSPRKSFDVVTNVGNSRGVQMGVEWQLQGMGWVAYSS